MELFYINGIDEIDGFDGIDWDKIIQNINDEEFILKPTRYDINKLIVRIPSKEEILEACENDDILGCSRDQWYKFKKQAKTVLSEEEIKYIQTKRTKVNWRKDAKRSREKQKGKKEKIIKENKELNKKVEELNKKVEELQKELQDLKNSL